MDCAIEDSIKSTYLTTSGANRSCRCLWNFPLHKLSRTEKQRLGKGPQLLCQHTTYTQRGLSSTLNLWLLREPLPPKKREKEKSSGTASKFMLQSVWEENGILKHFIHLRPSSQKEKQSFSFKSNKTATDPLLGFLAPTPFLPRCYQEERLCYPSFITLPGRKVHFTALCCVRYSKMLRVLLS